MTIITPPTKFFKPAQRMGHSLRLLTGILLFSGLIACAATPTETPVVASANDMKFDTGLSVAQGLYNSGDYNGAANKFDGVISNQGASAGSRRLAHLGKALIYLGSDSDWRSLENAKMSLMAAGQVASDGSEAFSIGSDLLMDAVSTVIGTESKYAVIVDKSGSAIVQVTELKRELDASKAERNELLAEQKVLNEAIEKLKELTLSN